MLPCKTPSGTSFQLRKTVLNLHYQLSAYKWCFSRVSCLTQQIITEFFRLEENLEIKRLAQGHIVKRSWAQTYWLPDHPHPLSLWIKQPSFREEGSCSRCHSEWRTEPNWNIGLWCTQPVTRFLPAPQRYLVVALNSALMGYGNIPAPPDRGVRDCRVVSPQKNARDNVGPVGGSIYGGMGNKCMWYIVKWKKAMHITTYF